MIASFKMVLARLLALVVALAFAFTPAQARVTAQPAAAIIAHPALWKVTRGASTVYLFGTIHALPAGVEWLHGPVARAFAGSDTLVTEILDKSPEEMRDIVIAKALLPEGESLRASLSAPARAALAKALKANDRAPEALDHYRPWFAAVALSMMPILQSGYDPANGVDTQLSALAKGKGQAHEALETVEFQFGLFDSLPMELQRSYLEEVARAAPRITSELGTMIKAWKAGDAMRLARLMNADASDARLAQVLLYERNRQWARWIKARLEKPGTVFIAVGAGHLAGKGSVQDQLKILGIAASRVQ